MIIETTLDTKAEIPHRVHTNDAGADLYALYETVVNSGEIAQISTGVALNIPEGYVGLIFSRSGHGKKGIRLANSVGVVDAGYQGEIIVLVTNDDIKPYTVKAYERIAQIVVIPCEYPEFKVVDQFSYSTDRSEKGFGSTG